MLEAIVLPLDLYFSAMLGVAGIAKLRQPSAFAATLRRHRILPPWSISPVSRGLPWVQVAIALLLVSGSFPIVTSIAALALLVSFLMTECILLATKRATDCGCYGVAYRMKVDGASVAASSILVLLALVRLLLTSTTAAVEPSLWRFSAAALVLTLGTWFLWRSRAKRSGPRNPLAQRA